MEKVKKILICLLVSLSLAFQVNVVKATSNEDYVYSYLTNTMGLNSAAACGVMANIHYESNFNPNATGDSGTSYGICQWHNSRWTDLKTYCNNNGYSWTTLEGQCHFLEYELKKSYSGVLSYIKSVDNTSEGAYNAGYYWCYHFEIPANKASVSVTRGNYAKNTYWPVYGIGDTCNCSESYAGTYTCTTSSSNLNMRSGHGTSYSVVGSIPPGAQVTVTKANGEWAHVTYNGVSGYASMTYLSKVSSSRTTYNTIFASLKGSGYSLTEAKADASNNFTEGQMMYIWGYLSDADGNLYKSYGSGTINQILTIYKPDGSTAYSYTYEDSDNNWIGYRLNVAGTWEIESTVTGALTGTVTKSITVGHSAVTDAAVAATCTSTGKTAGSHCSVCGAVITAQTTTSALGHNYSSSITKAATCTSTGVRTYTCTRCGNSYTETISATGHSYSSSVTKAATCTTSGIRTYTCSKCGNSYTTTISATGHTAVTDAAVAATCTTSGKTAGSHCSVCGTVITAQSTVSALGHNYSSSVTKAATCTSTGVRTYTCTRCGNSYTTTISATGHTAVTDAAVAATCTTAGKTAGSHCSVCGTVITAQSTVSALGHNWNSGTITKAATCTSTGVKTYTCTRCNTTKTETISATGHSYSSSITKSPTCTATGVRTYTCSKCGNSYTTTISATGHTAVTDAAVAATCTTSGKTAGSHCSVCGTVITAQSTVSALGHNWNSGTVTKAATCSSTGVKTYTCTRCNTTKTETIAKTGHSYATTTTKATLTKDGSIVSKCSVCGTVGSTTAILHPSTFTLSNTSYTYDGSAKNPSLTVKDTGGNVIASSNYTVTKDKGRTNVGTYSYKIVFKGNYSGTKTVSFTINPADVTITSAISVEEESIRVKASATASSLGADGFEIIYKKIGDSEWTHTTNTITSTNIRGLTPGCKYYVRMRAYKTVGNITYYSNWSTQVTSESVICPSHSLTTTVTKATLTKDGSIVNKCSLCGYEETTTISHPSIFTLSYTTYEYTGGAKNPSLTVKDAEGNVITSSNYTVTKDAGRINVGTYSYKVVFKGNYSGTKTVKFVINPAQAVIKEIGVGTNNLTVKASATASSLGADGYEVIYRPVGTTAWTYVTNATTTIRLTDLPTGTAYQVRMRAYKVVNGTTYCGAWSTISYSPKVR